MNEINYRMPQNMPRTPGIRRYIFNTLTVVSLLLMLGTAGFWVDSGSIFRRIGFGDSQHVEMYISNYYGQVWIGRIIFDQGTWHDGWFVEQDSINADTTLLFKGFDWPGNNELVTYHLEIQAIGIPHWFFTLIFAILPAIWLFKWNKRRKLCPNACSGCGYDLTGNETGVCPECGVAAQSVPKSLGDDSM